MEGRGRLRIHRTIFFGCALFFSIVLVYNAYSLRVGQKNFCQLHNILILIEALYYNTGLSKAGVAQQAEQLICNQQVAGSSPITSSGGEVPERPKGADCKSVVSDFGGSNPPLSTINMVSWGRGSAVASRFLQLDQLELQVRLF